MSRIVKIEKVGKSTVIEVINENQQSPEIIVINKLTNVTLVNDTITIKSEHDFRLCILFSEIYDKLTAVDAKDYLKKAAAIFLFNQ